MTFTDTGGPPKAFGWQGEKKPHAAKSLPKAGPRAPGLDIGRINDFEKGVKESRDQTAKTALKMAGVYVAVKAWSAWRGHLREKP